MSSTECSVRDFSAVPATSPIPTRWPAIASLTLGVFSLVTAEFLPASLLTVMAADLGVSETIAGQRAVAGDADGTALKSRTEHSVEDT